MPEHNAAIKRVAVPPRLRGFPVDERGYIIPKFVEITDDGKADFRAFNREHWGRCVRLRICWICGQKLGRHLAFVVGPMGSISRVTSEPPSHLECARFATKVCPFMVYPQRPRNTVNLPSNVVDPAGKHAAHNPGAMCIWVTGAYKVFRVPGPGHHDHLIEAGDPSLIEWWSQGRLATREEVIKATQFAIPFLRAEAETVGKESVAQLDKNIAAAFQRMPG